MPSRQARVLIIGDEPVVLLLEQLILEEEGYALTVTASEDAASRILADINPVLVMLDTGLTGQKIRKLFLAPTVMVIGKDQNDDAARASEMPARAKAAPWVTEFSGAPVEVAFLARELHVDFVERRVTVVAQEVPLSDIDHHVPCCMACGSSSFAPQRPILVQNRGDQCLGGAVVLYVNLSQIRQGLERYVLRVGELIVWASAGLCNLVACLWNIRSRTGVCTFRASVRKLLGQAGSVRSPWSPKAGARTRIVRELVARHPTLTVSLPLRAKLAACLQFLQYWRQYYSWRSPIRKAPGCEDIEQSSGLKKAGAGPEPARPPVDRYEAVWTASGNPAALPNPGLDRFLVTQCQTFGSKLEAFLQALFDAYSKVAARGGNDPLLLAPVVPLVDVYASLHWSPRQTSEYSKNEFARDIYLLHRSGLATTISGAQVSFPISRGVPEKTFTTTDEKGVEKRYYGIRFVEKGGLRGRHAPGVAPQQLPAYSEARLTSPSMTE